MATAEQLITENLDIWTSAFKAKSSAGRGAKRNRELYGVQKLRALILELAITGKLVAQDPNDEPAAKLLRNIATEKAMLVAQGRIKKQKELPRISQKEIPFNLPKGWQWCRLDDIGHTHIGLTYSPKETSEEFGIPVLRSSNIQDGIICLKDIVRVDKPVQEKLIVLEGDLLICARNGSKRLIGKCALVPKLNEKATFGAFMAIFRSSLNVYIKWFLESPIFRKKLEGVTTTTINQLTQANLRSTTVPIPPLTEQHRIVAKVDELMALCDQLEQEQETNLETHKTLVSTVLDALTSATADASQFAEAWQSMQNNFDILFTTESSVDQLKQTILQLAVMGKLVPQDNELDTSIIEHSEEISAEEIPYAKPPGWKWKRISDHVNIRGGSQPSKNTFANEPKDGYTRLIQIRDFKSDNFKTYIPIELANRPFTKEDIMIGRYGPPVFQILRGLEGSYNVALMKADPDLKYITRDYLFYLLKEPRIQKIIIDESERTAGQSGIRLPLLNSIFYGLPPISEQHCIVARIEALMALCDQLKANLASAQDTQLNLADSLVEQAIN